MNVGVYTEQLLLQRSSDIQKHIQKEQPSPQSLNVYANSPQPDFCKLQKRSKYMGALHIQTIAPESNTSAEVIQSKGIEGQSFQQIALERSFVRKKKMTLIPTSHPNKFNSQQIRDRNAHTQPKKLLGEKRRKSLGPKFRQKFHRHDTKSMTPKKKRFEKLDFIKI